jgi:hypothetical protein
VVVGRNKSASLQSDKGAWQQGEEVQIKVRLSTTSKDVKLPVRTLSTIAECKRALKVSLRLLQLFSAWAAALTLFQSVQFSSCAVFSAEGRRICRAVHSFFQNVREGRSNTAKRNKNYIYLLSVNLLLKPVHGGEKVKFSARVNS